MSFSGWLSVLVHLYTQTIYSKILERWVIFATGSYPFSHKNTCVGRPSLLMFLAHRSGSCTGVSYCSNCTATFLAYSLPPQMHGPLYMALRTVCYRFNWCLFLSYFLFDVSLGCPYLRRYLTQKFVLLSRTSELCLPFRENLAACPSSYRWPPSVLCVTGKAVICPCATSLV